MTQSATAVTPKKDLRGGNSVWSDSRGTGVHFRPLGESLRADVVVVGAGISGACMAYALSQRYDRVVVLDRRAPFHGSTSASTAMLQFEIDEPLTSLSEKIGAAKAVRAWQRSFRATRELVSLIEAEDIRCGMQRRNALYLAGNDMGSRGLEKENKARRRAGLPGEFLDHHALKTRFGIGRTGAILSPKSAVANPRQLAAGLLRHAVSNGATIYSPVNVAGVTASPHGVVLDTGHHFIEAKHVVFCTGYEALKGVPAKGTKITSSWAIASPPHAEYPAWLNETIVWEASTPYLYVRTTPDGRIIAGGEDEEIDLPSYRSRSIGRKSARLAAKVATLIPGLEFVPTHRWTGAFGESDNGLPRIGAVPGMPGCFAVMGFGGNGTIYSFIAAQIIPSLLKGRPDKDASLFRFR